MKLPMLRQAAFLSVLLYAGICCVAFSSHPILNDKHLVLSLPSNFNKAPLKSFLSKKDTAKWVEAAKSLEVSGAPLLCLHENEQSTTATLVNCKVPPAFFIIAKTRTLFDDYATPRLRIINQLNVDLHSGSHEKWIWKLDTVFPPESFSGENVWDDFKKNMKTINDSWLKHESGTFQYVAIWYADSKPMTYKSIVLFDDTVKGTVKILSSLTMMKYDVDYLKRAQEVAPTLTVDASPLIFERDIVDRSELLDNTKNAILTSDQKSYSDRIKSKESTHEKPNSSTEINFKSSSKLEMNEELSNLLRDWKTLYEALNLKLLRRSKISRKTWLVDIMTKSAIDAKAGRETVTVPAFSKAVSKLLNIENQDPYRAILKNFYTMLVDIVLGYFQKYASQELWLKYQEAASLYNGRFHVSQGYFDCWKARNDLNSFWKQHFDTTELPPLDELRILMKYTALTEEHYEILIEKVEEEMSKIKKNQEIDYDVLASIVDDLSKKGVKNEKVKNLQSKLLSRKNFKNDFQKSKSTPLLANKKQLLANSRSRDALLHR